MKFYGLHFVGDDRTPLQVCVDTRNQRVFARSCPNGEWTSWRRLDVMRNADGTLAEEVAEATHAKSADVASRLRTAMRMLFKGDVTGEVRFDGSIDVEVNLSSARLNSLESRIAALEKSSSSGSYRDE